MVIVGAGEEYWVPATPKHLKGVDLEARTIMVDWPAHAP
jgi:ribosomal 30S subunit maturation factor RimM